MDLRNKKVLVVGLARSGVGAIELLSQIGAVISAYDSKEKSNFNDLVEKWPEVSFSFGTFDDELLRDIDLIVLSPGVPTDLKALDTARQRGIPVWGELEMAYRFFKGRLIAITGTNGKTTTTTLIGELMKSFYSDVYVVGNIGVPFSEVVLRTNEESVVVVEVSSFQLESIHQFRPEISCILNITPDHLNRHKTMKNYIDAKKRVTENQDNHQLCILNEDDEEIKKIKEEIIPDIFGFSRQSQLDEGIYIKDKAIVLRRNGKITNICHTDELQVLGECNVENIMAATAVAVHMGVPTPLIKKVVTSFKGVEHRIEYVTTIAGVSYYNDSKATNPDAAIQGVKAMIRPTLLIAGGMDKGSNYDPWFDAFGDKVTHLILLGETKDKIEAVAIKRGLPCIKVATLKEAVEKAHSMASEGDAVLLSPACASWDMFKSYEERGHLFKTYVVSLGE